MTYRDDQDRFFADQGFDQRFRQIERNRALLAERLRVRGDRLVAHLQSTVYVREDLAVINDRPRNLSDDEQIAWCVEKLGLDR